MGNPLTSSSLLEIDTNGNVKLKDGVKSASIYSPVVNTGSVDAVLRVIKFTATEDPTLPAGFKQVIDWDKTTITREIRYRMSNNPFSQMDTEVPWKITYNTTRIDVQGLYFQVEYTLRIDGI